MPSFSSVQGVKMHASKYFLTDVLKVQLGFDGFVITDYNGIQQITSDEEGNSIPSNNLKQQLKVSINAGNDMLMQASNWATCITSIKQLVADELANPGSGIPMSRIDDAVTRILRVKFQSGLFENPMPPNPASNPEIAAKVGSAGNRALAREAVSKSLVLLKNDVVNGSPIVSQLKNMNNIFVAGKSADNIGNQSGGWTISWQGSSGNITAGTTILKGIQDAVGTNKVTYSANGTGAAGKDVAIVVIGEIPYAEGNGDNGTGSGANKTYLKLDATDLATLNNVKAAGIPTIVVLVSGRPLEITGQLDNIQGLVAAWLPGTEGAGVADVLFGNQDFVGKLSMKWPFYYAAIPEVHNDAKYVLFNVGYGLTKSQATPVLPAAPAEMVVMPTSSLAPGGYSGSINVTLSSSTTGVTIYYTTNGSTPTTASSTYTGAITVSADTTIKAIAVKAGMANSFVAEFPYVIKVATPTASPAAGTFTTAQNVTLTSATAGATIYYTVDNSKPTTSSTLYTGPISISANTNIRAIAVKTGMTNSLAPTFEYLIRAATPTASPAAGTYTSVQSVTLTSSTAGASFYYTVDNSAPTISSHTVHGSDTVGSSTTIRAIAVKAGMAEVLQQLSPMWFRCRLKPPQSLPHHQQQALSLVHKP